MDIPMTFVTILTFSTLFCALFWVYERYYWKRKHPKKKSPVWLETVAGLFPVLLIVFVIRSFIYEPFRIPSGSMKPGLLEGDFILVNKYTYGMRMPIWGNLLVPVSSPKRGDVMVFHFPPDPSQDFIKRVVGLPGDTITYKDKALSINGVAMVTEFEATDADIDVGGPVYRVNRWSEKFASGPHQIFIDPNRPVKDVEFEVPAGHYFMMGDNRDHSRDSRAWGVVPDKLIVGKAVRVWMSWDPITHSIRFDRIGKKI